MPNLIRKANAFEILNHWLLALSCLVLALQGYAFLFHIEGIGALFGGFASMRMIHNYLGIAFAVALFFTLFFYLKESLTFDADDIGWIKVAGGYLSRRATVPPMGKLNTGQKLYYLAVLVCGIAISASGFVFWLAADNKQWVSYAHLLHNLSFVFLMLAVPVHMYLGSLANPGTFRIMISGTIPYWWAKKKHPKWVAELESQR